MYSCKKLKQLDEEIVTIVSDENCKKIEDIVRGTKSDNGEFNQRKFWEVKKKFFQSPNEPPAAMRDKNGNLVTSSAALKELYMKTYKERLSPAIIEDDDTKEIIELKKKLWEVRKYVYEKRQSVPWKMRY